MAQDTKIMRKFLLFLLFTLPTSNCLAQFSQWVTPSTLTPRADSIKINSAPQLNMLLYNEAYDKYLRTLRFKQRNKILIKDTGLSLTQASFDNWSSGGLNSISARAFVHLEHTYTDERWFNIHSIFEGAMSIIQSDGKLRKSEDYWNLNIKPNWKIAPKWELSGDFMVKSQFASTFKPLTDSTSELVSSIMSPGDINASAGVTYVAPKGRIKIYLAPLSGSLRIVLNDELAALGNFGMEKGQKFKPSFGMLFRLEFNTKFAKDKLEYITKIESFWNYDSDPTVWWENKLNFKITNLLGLNFYLLAKYDRNTKTPRVAEGGTNFFDYWQINQSLGLALRFNYQSKPPQKIESNYVKPAKRKK